MVRISSNFKTANSVINSQRNSPKRSTVTSSSVTGLNGLSVIGNVTTTGASSSSPKSSPLLKLSAANNMTNISGTNNAAAAAAFSTPGHSHGHHGPHSGGHGSHVNTTPQRTSTLGGHNSGGGLLNYKANLTGLNGSGGYGHHSALNNNLSKDSTKVPSKDSTLSNISSNGNHGGHYHHTSNFGTTGSRTSTIAHHTNGGNNYHNLHQQISSGLQPSNLFNNNNNNINDGTNLTTNTNNLNTTGPTNFMSSLKNTSSINVTPNLNTTNNLLSTPNQHHHMNTGGSTINTNNMITPNTNVNAITTGNQINSTGGPGISNTNTNTNNNINTFQPQSTTNQAQTTAGPGVGDNPETDFPDLGHNRYEILKFIGSGGEGSVYEAYDKIERVVVALKVGNKVFDANVKSSTKAFDKELTIYHHCLRYRHLHGIPKLVDCRVRNLVDAYEQQQQQQQGNGNNSSTANNNNLNGLCNQRNYLVQQLGHNSGLATAQRDIQNAVKNSGKDSNLNANNVDLPDYLSLTLFGPSLRMMLQSVLSHRAQVNDDLQSKGLPVAHSSNTMELRSIYMIAEKMIHVLENLHRANILHHDVKPQNLCFKDRNRSLESDIVREGDELALIDLGMSYFVAENTRPKRHCRFCGSMDYSSKASRYRCQPSKRDDLESLGYLLLWLVMGNRSYKAWRSAVLEPYWEMLSVLYDDKPDIADVLSCPSNNVHPYSVAIERQDDPNKVFIRRSAVQQKTNNTGPNGKGGRNNDIDKKCDLSLFNTHSSRPDDIIEGNLPKLNRDKVPEKILYYILYCQSLSFAETPNYSGLRKMFQSSELKRIGSVANPPFYPGTSAASAGNTTSDMANGGQPAPGTYNPLSVKQSNAQGIPDWLRQRFDDPACCAVPVEHRSGNKYHIPEKVVSTDELLTIARGIAANRKQQQQMAQQQNAQNQNQMGNTNSESLNGGLNGNSTSGNTTQVAWASPSPGKKYSLTSQEPGTYTLGGPEQNDGSNVNNIESTVTNTANTSSGNTVNRPTSIHDPAFVLQEASPLDEAHYAVQNSNNNGNTTTTTSSIWGKKASYKSARPASRQ